MSSLIRATNLWGFDELVRLRGGDPGPLLARYHIPPEEQRDDRSFLIYRNVAALFDDTARALDYPVFGLKLAQYQGMDILGPISVIARSSSTVGDAVQSIARYLHLHCPALQLTARTESSDVAQLLYRVDDESTGYRVQAYELAMANAMQVLKLLCGESIAPLSVHFRHQQVGDAAIYKAVFNSPVYFQQPWCGFRMHVSAFAIPLISVDHQTWQLADRYLQSQQVPNAATVSEDVIGLIRTLLPTGRCSSETIAAHLAMHKRTLQRHLDREGTSYEKLLSAQRRHLAEQYLLEPKLKLSQIAGLLGYSEQSALNRACRQWFGLTPGKVRARLLNEPTSANGHGLDTTFEPLSVNSFLSFRGRPQGSGAESVCGIGWGKDPYGGGKGG